MTDELSLDDAVAFLEEPEAKAYVPPEQLGPIRHHGTESRCLARWCSSPTYYSFRGMKMCWVHIIERANELFVSLGVER